MHYFRKALKPSEVSPDPDTHHWVGYKKDLVTIRYTEGRDSRTYILLRDKLSKLN